MRQAETARCHPRRPAWARTTCRMGWDGDRLAHNPEVAGSNPAPATSFRRSRPFSRLGGAFCASRTVVKFVVGAGLRAVWQCDAGDGLTRDETSRTCWTLLSALAGCPAQRSRTCIPVSSHSRWTSWNMWSPGVRPGPPAASRGIRLPRARDQPLLQSDDGVAGRRGADATAYFPPTLTRCPRV
jgi:hypothetical protein